MFAYLRIRFARAVSDFIAFVKRHVPGWIIALAGTALGVPLVGVLAGADMTEEALLLLAMGVLGPSALIVLAFLWFYWNAPARIYLDQLAENQSLQDQISRLNNCDTLDEDPRMSLPELIEFAEQVCGWKIRAEHDSMEVLDLRDWLSDVAGIGRVKIYGRYNPHHMSNLGSISPVEIPVSHWVDHELYSFDALYFGLNEKGISRDRMSRDHRQAYVDLHVNREQARDLDCQHKTAFVLCHKLREAMASEINGQELDDHVEIDGAYFGGSIRPANRVENRVDRRKAEYQTGKRRVVVALRERHGRTLPFVCKQEAEGVSIAARVAAKATAFYADEAGHGDALHTKFKTYRINHREAYADGHISTNQAESYFSRLRRMVEGQHHHVSPQHLHQYANHAAWIEDNRRKDNGTLAYSTLHLALTSPVSRQWAGYWQRAA